MDFRDNEIVVKWVGGTPPVHPALLARPTAADPSGDLDRVAARLELERGRLDAAEPLAAASVRRWESVSGHSERARTLSGVLLATIHVRAQGSWPERPARSLPPQPDAVFPGGIPHQAARGADSATQATDDASRTTAVSSTGPGREKPDPRGAGRV
jgi:hypothetical protein